MTSDVLCHFASSLDPELRLFTQLSLTEQREVIQLQHWLDASDWQLQYQQLARLCSHPSLDASLLPLVLEIVERHFCALTSRQHVPRTCTVETVRRFLSFVFSVTLGI